MSESRLRRKLRSGDLSGMQMSRRDDEMEWTPLHQRPIFSQEVPHDGDPRRAAWSRQLNGYLGHMAAFLAVMIFLGFPWWGLFWGIGVIAHTLQTIPAIRGLFGQPDSPPMSTTQTEISAGEEDPFLVELETALADLEGQGEGVQNIRKQARELHQRRLQLDAAVQVVDLSLLEQELSERIATAGASNDDADRGFILREADALQSRLDALRAASQRRDRLVAQERELLHALEGTRLAMLSAMDANDHDASVQQLEDIQQRLAAREEVRDDLDRARRAAQRQQQQR
ncbi:MAG: hypothetical protein AAFV53_36435 [Myxococcota bacterium]